MMDNSAARGMPDYSVGSTLTVKKSTPLFLIKRLTFPFFALLALLAVGTLSLLPGGPLQAQEAAIQYPENGTGPVATYTAADPEGTEIVSWTLAGDDAGDFNIEGGVLTFKKSPDFEAALGMGNMYSVTVQATDETNKVGTRQVTVEVINLDEPGTVTLSALRPQSNVMLTATHTDPDMGVSDLKWQWARSMSKNGSYTDIEHQIASVYEPVDDDIDYYLRATASYADAEGSDKTAMAVSDYAVQAVRGANQPPKFADDQDAVMDDVQEEAKRKVVENTAAGKAIGDPVVAEDKDGDILTYTLTGDNAASFSIDWATGQIMTKGVLDVETTPTYEVVVRATDPAGIPQAETAVPANSDTVTVMITVTNVNEPPTVTGQTSAVTNNGAALTFQEENGKIADLLNTYMEADPEAAGDSIWSVAGADASKFEISITGALTFKAKPDFEKPGDANTDNVYEVTVVAADADGNRGTMDVKVMVANEDEPGMVTLSRTQPRVGVAVKASLTDPDGSISGLTWQWYRSSMIDVAVDSLPMEECADDDDECVIKGARSDTHTPTAGDVGKTLMAVAMYTDGEGSGKNRAGGAATVVAVDTRNRPPAFDDQDDETEGIQNDETTRKVEENAKADSDNEAADNVGSPVTATDLDPNEDPLIYTLGGTDAASFTVRDDGQIEVGAGTKLDYETKQTYTVTVRAADSYGESDTIMVTITVTDVDEMPDVTGEASIEYAENGTRRVATYAAVDPERTAIVSWSLGGDDDGDFNISDNGVLTFVKSPDFEMAVDMGTANMYSVTVQATDSTNKTGTKEVTVEVTNMDEPGTVTLSAVRPQSATDFTATLTDPDNMTGTNVTGAITSGITWQWAKASSKNGSYTNIDKATATTYRPVDGDIGSYLRATASYTDPEGSDKTAMAKSEYSVQRPRGQNSAPKFADDQDAVMDDVQEEAKRTVPENTAAGVNIGDPVVAEDTNGDKLTYTLLDMDGGSANFSIDWATGQIMTKGVLDVETTPTYEVVVRATDPAGIPQAETAVPANSDTVTVMITVTNVNEPPTVTGQTSAVTNNGAALTFQEENGKIADLLNTYMEADPEAAGDSIWSVAGADASKFEISITGALTFKAKPDFEKPGDANTDNVYEVTVVAADADGNRGTMDVKVMVANEDEPGMVTLSRTQPRVGVAVKASLTDPDGSISGLTWQWYRSSMIDVAVDSLPMEECADDDDECVIKGARSDTHTPTAGDVGKTLMAVAMYTDGEGSGKNRAGGAATVVAVDTRNRPPAFDDQDDETEGIQNDETTRKVEENAKADSDNEAADNVGSPVTATDLDPNEDPLIYTLGGTDAASFTVRDDGQIEVGAGTKLDYETKQTYTVTVRAADSYGESDTIMVTITVTDMDEAPTIMVGGLAVTGQSAIDYAENSTGMVAAYGAVGPDAAMATWSLDGDDAGDFRISTAGVLTFRTSPNYESPADADGDNVYEVTVTANDGENTTTRDVTITVTDMEEEESADPLLAEYDPDGDGVIERADMRRAVADFFGPQPTLSRADMRRLVGMFFSS